MWKGSWAPDYHPSMFICIAALGLAIVLAFGECIAPSVPVSPSPCPYLSIFLSWLITLAAIRCLLVRENRRLEREELDGLQGARRERVEEAARLEGITLAEAVRRRGGFRYPL